MKSSPGFSNLLSAARHGWQQRKSDDLILSLAIPVTGVDPLHQLPVLAGDTPFRFLWDGAPGLCFAAAGRCQHLDLAGPRRFELTQRFSDATLARLSNTSPDAPAQARPRILMAFSFFDEASERQRRHKGSPPAQAVLPRWQLSRHGKESWLRLNGVVTDASEARELAEQLWLMAEALTSHISWNDLPWHASVPGTTSQQPWEECYRPALTHGLDLVDSGELHKLVVAVRQSIRLQEPLNPLSLLFRLRLQQSGSCRYLWQRSEGDAFFGASPERLLRIRGNQLRSDALAGTAGRYDNGQNLLRSDKDRREHQLVVETITSHLKQLDLSPQHPSRPQLARQGHLVHLHTPITANAKGHLPLTLASTLHPTPAVAGLPRREAMAWLRALEPFDRGGYAGPIGWIDSAGDAELRVAIRCGHAHGTTLDLTAGAGLVKGSIAERELQEVSLKLAVLADQLDLRHNTHSREMSSRLMT